MAAERVLWSSTTYSIYIDLPGAISINWRWFSTEQKFRPAGEKYRRWRCMKDNFAIDARMYLSGIGVYTSNLVEQAQSVFGLPIHAMTRSDQASRLSPFCARVSAVDAPIYSVKEQFAVAWAARSDKVLHVPHYNIPLLYPGTLLATIHDVTHIVDRRYRKGWKSRLYGGPMLRACARRAAHLFTVSEYSKSQIMEHLGVRPEKITVVYNGVGSAFFPDASGASVDAVRRRFHIDSPFILYVGNLKPHKNVEALLRAYSELKPSLREHQLVLVGSDRSGEASIRRFTERLGVTPHFIPDATTEEVAHLYRAAKVLVLPSFEEGFGLPVIEAMASGTPVICSNRAALPEVAGHAALFFDPEDATQLAGQLDSLLSSSSLQVSLREKGLRQAAHFTWRETARRHVEVYRRHFKWASYPS